MKKFMLVVLIVIAAVAVLAACAPVQAFGSQVGDYAKTLPLWVIVVGAIIVFFIGFAIIWKLIPGFIKVLALIALVVIIGGVAYGLWNIPYIDKETIDSAGKAIESILPQSNTSPTVSTNN